MSAIFQKIVYTEFLPLGNSIHEIREHLLSTLSLTHASSLTCLHSRSVTLQLQKGFQIAMFFWLTFSNKHFVCPYMYIYFVTLTLNLKYMLIFDYMIHQLDLFKVLGSKVMKEYGMDQNSLRQGTQIFNFCYWFCYSLDKFIL